MSELLAALFGLSMSCGLLSITSLGLGAFVILLWFFVLRSFAHASRPDAWLTQEIAPVN